MTCIVAVKGDREIVVCGDSAGVSGLDMCIRKDPKVFKVGAFVIGFTSSFRMGQVLMDLKVPRQTRKQSDFQYMRTTFITAVQKLFEKTGFLKKEGEQKSGGTFLVVYKEEIYRIEDDFQVEVRRDPFNACGCGESYAIGALAALDSEDYRFNPLECAEKALSVAAKYSGGVAPPWTVVRVIKT